MDFKDLRCGDIIITVYENLFFCDLVISGDNEMTFLTDKRNPRIKFSCLGNISEGTPTGIFIASCNTQPVEGGEARQIQIRDGEVISDFPSN